MADYSGLSISSLYFAIIIMQTLIISSPRHPPPLLPSYATILLHNKFCIANVDWNNGYFPISGLCSEQNSYKQDVSQVSGFFNVPIVVF